MKAKFRSVYGLDDKVKVIMKDPNGDLVTDDSTPEDIEMEPDDQIDVTVREGGREGVREGVCHGCDASRERGRGGQGRRQGRSIVSVYSRHRGSVVTCAYLCSYVCHYPNGQILPELYAKAVACAEPPKAGRMMRFVTKLNGKHIRKWQIAPTDTFAKVVIHDIACV
jgi:hypothetical protein